MAGASEVIVAEGPGHRRDSEYLITASGLYEHLRDHHVRFVDLNQDDVGVVPLGSRYTGLKSLAFPLEVLRADIIVSMPKLKTHHWAGMTASMKNLFGTVPGAVYGWPKNILHAHGINESIIDLTATLRPHLTIVDAVTAMEGDGPIMGRPRHMGFVALGRDLVSVDATCARIIGLDPLRIPYLRIAGGFLGNLEDARIQHRGENPGRYATVFDVVDSIKPFRIGQPAASPAILPYFWIVGQTDLKLALALSYIEPQLLGVLISGKRGTAKSTAVRAFALSAPAVRAPPPA